MEHHPKDTEDFVRTITGVSLAYEFQFSRLIALARGGVGVVPRYTFTVITRGKDFEECLELARNTAQAELTAPHDYRMSSARAIQ